MPGVLVPIPLASKRAPGARLQSSGARLAAALAVQTGLSISSDLLARHRETPTQTTLPAGRPRRANVAGAFECGTVPAGARVVLVDDVFTTGATLAEAAATLLEAGAGTVESVTFARARPPVY